MLYGVIFFAAAMSVVSGTGDIRIYKIYAYIVIGLYIFLGIYYVFTSRAIRKRKINRLLMASLVSMLTRYDFRLPLVQFALENSIYLEQAESFVRSSSHLFTGTLTIDKSGIIIYDYKKILLERL
jgi:Ca2+/Na+ antiporter